MRNVFNAAVLAAVVVLATTLTGFGTAAAAPGIDLRDCPLLLEGDTSDCVAAMQTELNAVNGGYHLNPDRSFGADTRIALLDFQGRNHLGADGNAGPETLRLLQQQYEAKSPSAPVAPPQLTDREICEALGGDLWLPDGKGGCVPDAAIPDGKSAAECAAEAAGKKVITEFRKKWAEEGAAAAAEVGTKEAAKSLAKKLVVVPGIFKCIFFG